MTPGARIAAAAEILDEWRGGGERMEAILRAWGRANRYAGSGDRRAIGDIAFDCLRRLRSYGAIGGGEQGRAVLLGRELAHGRDPAEVFTGLGHAPGPLTDAEAALSGALPDDVGEAAALDAPDWLAPRLVNSLGADCSAVLAAMRERAPVFLRVNMAKSDPSAAKAALLRETPPVICEDVPGLVGALRTDHSARIAASSAYRDGLVELQDASSQAAAAFALPAGARTVLDFCAGGGGKALAFASHLGGAGRLIAHDAEPRRMKDIAARAARAGAWIEIAEGAPDPALLASCDLVFVDAPCSGSGTWRRDPEAKWRLSAERLDELKAAQAAALSEAARFVRPGGTLAYATCSLLREENEDQTDAFIRRDPAFRLAEHRRWSPLDPQGGDGFFCATLLRRET